MSQELHSTEKCGVIGVVGEYLSVQDFANGFSARQHRGGDAAGVLSLSGKSVTVDDVMGGIEDLFEETTGVENYTVLIGHNRYTTSAGMSMSNAQPFFFKQGKHSLGLAHNGNIPTEYLRSLKKMLTRAPSAESSDSYILTKILLRARTKHASWMDTFVTTLALFKGAFSLICVTEEGCIYAIRDPWGIRPLCLGKRDGAWVVVSETVALDAMGAQYVREVLPGEIICLRPDGTSLSILYAKHIIKEHRCLLETIYFYKNKSFDGRSHVWEQRRALGRSVAARFAHKNIPIDLVIPILNSGKEMAIGASDVLGMVN